MKTSLMIAAAAVALSASASSAPVTTLPPQPLGAGGDVNAVYVFSNAADLDVTFVSSPISMFMYCNHTAGSCTAAAAGDHVNLGTVGAGVPIVFRLDDISVPATFFSDTADTGVGGDGFYHAWISQNFSDFGINGGVVPTAAADVIDDFDGTVWYVGWEDRRNFDFDYNDLVFAIVVSEPDENPGAPEPLTLSLLGAGLLGAFGLRHIRKR